MDSERQVRDSYNKHILSTLIVILCVTSTWEQTVCRDTNFFCSSWSSRGLCQSQRNLMSSSCSQSCGFCSSEVIFPGGITGRPTAGVVKPSIGNPPFVCGRYERFTFNRQKRQLGNAFSSILGTAGSVLQRPGSSGSSNNNRPSFSSFGSSSRPSAPSFGSSSRPSAPSFGSNSRPSFTSFISNNRPSAPSFGSNRPSLPSFGINNRPSAPSFGSNNRPSNNNNRPFLPNFGNIIRPSPPSIPGFPTNIIPSRFIPTNIIPSIIRPTNTRPITLLPSIGPFPPSIFPTVFPDPTTEPPLFSVGGGIPGLTGTVGIIIPQDPGPTRLPNPTRPRPFPIPPPGPRPRPSPSQIFDPRPTPVRITPSRPIPVPGPTRLSGTNSPGKLPLFDDSICGSSPITDRFLLTAAHCFPDPAIRFQVILGNIDFSTPGGGNSRSQTVDIEQIIIHPQYKSRILYNDIALLKTVQTIRFSPSVFPNCIMPRSRDFSGLPLKVSGFGFVNGTHRSPVLQEAVLEGLNARNCESRYLNAGFERVLRGTFPELLQRKGILCASAEGRSACQGDSGGPLTFSDRGTTYLVGIVSVGPTCLSNHLPSRPGIYTDVSFFVDWIDSVIYGT